ncbi:MAG: hypothetical protein HFG83_15160 [Dorea sp.]|nr:hypothetical protein [Dorea sp.]MCI9455125.1 hypothetical protein [Dorea sp.]
MSIITNELARYDFYEVSSTIVPDLTGNGYAGVIRGCDRGGADMGADSVFGQTLPALLLSGGVNGGFLQLPDGILNTKEGFTVSFYAKLSPLSGFGTVFSFGRDYCFYLSAMPNPDNPEEILISPCATGGGRSQERCLEPWFPVPSCQWLHIAVSFSAGTPSNITLSVDGKACGSFEHPRMGAKALDHCSDCYFGFGSFAPAPIAAAITDIRIFSRTLEAHEISSLFRITPQMRLALDAGRLAGLFAKPLEKPISLPSAGQTGTTVTWKSLTPDIISDSGEFTRPAAGRECLVGALEAALSFEDCRMAQVFQCQIQPMPEDSVIARRDAQSVVLPFPGHVTEDLVLPLTGNNGSSFHWSSSRPKWMDNQGHLRKKPADAPEKLCLTLISSYGNAAFTREFPITLLADCCRSLPVREYVPAAPDTDETPQIQAYPATMEQLRLTGSGIFYDNQERCIRYLLFLNADRMLYNFRKAFGFDTKGAPPPGGWEEPSGLLRGHSTGHFLSALAHAFASTGDIRFRQKAGYIITELRKLQQASHGEPADFRTECTPGNAVQSLWSRKPDTWGEGFLSAYSPDQFALLEEFTPYATIWAPYYTLHKILAGLLDCHRLLESDDALSCACGIGNWVYRRLLATDREQRAAMWKLYIAGEYGGINESLAALYEATGNKDYLEAARMFDNPVLFDGLIHGRDPLSGIHANQHIPQIIGAMEVFRAAGDYRYYHLAKNFWELTINRYMYSIGGVGRGENFRDADILANHIEGGRNCETCATYNMLKLTGMLYQYAPDHSPYMDYYERALLNHIAASQNPDAKEGALHGVTYMLPIGPGAQKEYSNDYDDFTCCHGTGMENHVRYTEHIYHHGDDGSLYLNLFLPSVYCWEEKGVTLSLEGDFPSQCFRLTVHTKTAGRTVSLNLKIRIPYWCRQTFRVSDRIGTLPEPSGDSGYYMIHRTFADGDFITVSTPFALHLCYTNDAYEGYPAASLMYGPLVMTALSRRTDWITLNLPAALEDAFEIHWDKTPTLWYDDLEFIPSYAAHNQPYHTYFKINLT